MAQQDVLDYIRKTPHNSNVNVVKGMLEDSSNSALPEVTELDNGKVLTVVEGQWDKAEASSGGIDIPTITMVIYNTEGNGWITEEDANKIFDNCPIALKVRQIIDDEISSAIAVCFLNSYDTNSILYQNSFEGATTLFEFNKEQVIRFSMLQETTPVMNYEFTWDNNYKRYQFTSTT